MSAKNANVYIHSRRKLESMPFSLQSTKSPQIEHAAYELLCLSKIRYTVLDVTMLAGFVPSRYRDLLRVFVRLNELN